MVIEEIKKIKSGKRELRQFGITISLVLVILGSWLWWREKEVEKTLFIIAILLLSLSFLFPRILIPLHKLWMTLAVLLGWLMTRIILIILFYLVVTPIGLFAKLCGKDFLNRKFDREAQSYWIPRKPSPPDKKNYQNQF